MNSDRKNQNHHQTLGRGWGYWKYGDQFCGAVFHDDILLGRSAGRSGYKIERFVE